MSLLEADALYAEHAFQNALPTPRTIDTAKRSHVTLQVQEISQFLGLYDEDGHKLLTTVWGYGAGQTATYPGPTILAYQDHPVTVNWQNKLPVTGHLLPVDDAIHLADPPDHSLADGFVPIVTHLHGGHNDSAFDGLPDQWFTQNGGKGANGPRDVGPKFVTSTMTYQNDQEAATLWYHDHALGLTRLNVYAGLAGFYTLKDENRLELEKEGVLPRGAYDLGMAIQDRSFTSDGQLYYPAYKEDVLPGTDMTVGDIVPQAFYDAFGETAPSAVPEFFGDTILVNGMAWPHLEVAKGDYEFRLLNGSDSRFYVLQLSDPDVAVRLVGADGGLLPEARTIIDGDGVQEDGEFIVLAPGDRVELVFDFGQLENGDEVRLENIGPLFEPFKGVDPTGDLMGEAVAAGPDDPVGNIIEFQVNAKLKAFDASVADGTPLNAAFTDMTTDADQDGVADAAASVRKLGLFEGADEFGRIMPMLGTAEAGTLHQDVMHPTGDFGPLLWDAQTTETPLLGSTEEWEIFNFTADSHPIHVHLTQYQVVEKRVIDFQDEDENGVPDDTNNDGFITYGEGAANFSLADIWIGASVALRPEETGWQDTVEVDPNQMMSIVATFDKPGDYVWHCHILSHEDNEMMRPFTVTPDLA
ncbi:MAG: multicopper oxidase type 2 [Hyphomicrobiales bacterium]|nr:multicopper oxidase type 2 [Hyphomicrobiales bacterium]